MFKWLEARHAILLETSKADFLNLNEHFDKSNSLFNKFGTPIFSLFDRIKRVDGNYFDRYFQESQESSMFSGENKLPGIVLRDGSIFT